MLWRFQVIVSAHGPAEVTAYTVAMVTVYDFDLYELKKKGNLC